MAKNNKKNFNEFRKGMSHSFEFSISERMVNEFAVLTGDFNSLHVNKNFGRRTMFRRNTVHGMLPLSFVCLLGFFNVDSYVFIFQKITAKFSKPIFAFQTIVLKGIVSNFNKKNKTVNCDFIVFDKNSEDILTSGMIEGRYISNNCSKNVLKKRRSKTPEGMLLSTLKEKNLELKQISKLDKANFEFMVSGKDKQKLFAIFSEGVSDAKDLNLTMRESSIDMNNFLANLLFSTFVGMCIPGRHATFTNFSALFTQNIEPDKKHSLSGEVIFKSEPTETLMVKLAISSNDHNKKALCAQGELNVKVNKPPAKMPSIMELKRDGVDWGLKNRVVLITGASRGLGETMAKMFSLHGSKVVVNYFQGKNDAISIIKEIKKNGGEGFAHQADVTQLDQVKKMVRKICRVYGRVDILVNNAVGNTTPIDFLDLTWDKIQQDVDIVLKGAFNCCKEVIPVMVNNGGGKIINMSTLFVDAPSPKQAKYIVAKSGLVGLTRSLAFEFANKNILVNAVEPSITQTDLAAHVPKMFMDAIANESPLKRNASPVDVAKTVIYLASSYSSYTTGQKIMVTGGRPPFL